MEYERGSRLEETLALPDAHLLDLWHGRRKDSLSSEYESFSGRDAQAARRTAEASAVALLCICQPEYPDALRELIAPPAVLHVAGGIDRFLEFVHADPVAVVGARRATEYGRDVATSLGRGISASGLSVVSGMASGIDAAAHRGALMAGGRTVAVLPGSVSEPYPKQHRGLHAEVIRWGVALSEFSPGMPVRRWSFIARNRLIAGLSRLTIVVQAAGDSGALNTVERAHALGRRVGAVPGSVLMRQSEGPNAELARGATVIRDVQDVLDAIFGAGEHEAATTLDLSGLDESALAVLEMITGGVDTVSAITRAGFESAQALGALAGLELAGAVRRGAGGRYFATVKFVRT